MRENIYKQYLIRGLYQKYTKNSYNSIAKKKKKANNSIEKIVKRPGGLGVFPKKIYKWWTGIWKYAQSY